MNIDARKCATIWTSVLATLAITGVSFCAEITGPSNANVGELFVLESTGAKVSRWLIPDGYSPTVLNDGRRVASIPDTPGDFVFQFIAAEDGEIVITSHTVTVDDPEVSATPTKSAEPTPFPNLSARVKPAPPVPKPSVRKTAAEPIDHRPLLVFYSMPKQMGSCPKCLEWVRIELPKIVDESKTDGWRMAKMNTLANTTGISLFPSFEIRAGGKSRFLPGYHTAGDILKTRLDLEK